MATPFAMIVVPLTNPEAPSTDAVALVAQKADCNGFNHCGRRRAIIEWPSWIFAYLESENASVSISMKMRPSDPTHL
jgi:hypothetical protein